MRRVFNYYLTMMKIAILGQFQYRVANYFYMIGMIAEPVIYLVVWSTVAEKQGGSVGGYTAGAFTAYYIVWTLVRNMNIVFTPYGWEWRIQHGQLSGELLRPIHPLHSDIAFFAGWKVVVIILWLPLAAILSLIFKPSLNPTFLQVVVFFFAIWGAYLIRTMLLWLLGMIAFWTTRVGAIFELFFAMELILSGRLVPMPLMPLAAQKVPVVEKNLGNGILKVDGFINHQVDPRLMDACGRELALRFAAEHRALLEHGLVGALARVARVRSAAAGPATLAASG